MESQDKDPETLFEELVPKEAKADPDRLTYFILSEYTEAEVDELCTTWKLLGKNKAKLLKKIWKTHPDRPKEALSQPQGSDLLLGSRYR